MAGDVRQAIDVDSLSQYIGATVSEIKLPISIKQFGFGQSNPTYLLIDGDDCRFVLRKKPPGKLLSKTAHQVEREHRVIHALEHTDVPVPKTFALCKDEDVIGTPFYIMEFLDGRIFDDPAFPDVSPAHRRAMWYDAVRTLAKLHCVKPASVGLPDFGRPDGFYNRQIKTLGKIAASQAETTDVDTKVPVGQIPHFDSMVAFFADPTSQPRDRAALIHGDFKLDNLVFHKTEPRVIGILDWEMSTIGHPLSDLSNLLSPYTVATFPGVGSSSFQAPHRPEGLPSCEECMAWYAEGAGWDPRPESKFGEAFGVFRNSVIVQGIAARLALRQASSAQAKEHAVQLKPFGEFAWTLVQEAKAEGQRQMSKL